MDTITLSGFLGFLSPILGVGGGIWVAMRYISKIDNKADLEYVRTEFMKMQAQFNSEISNIKAEKELMKQQMQHDKQVLSSAVEQIRADLKGGIKEVKDAMQESFAIFEKLIENSKK